MAEKTKTNKKKKNDNNNPAFAVAAFHALLATLPNLVQSWTGTLRKDPLMPLLLTEESIKVITTPGISKSLFELFLFSVVMISVGYWRMYKDGAEQQPLLLLLEGVGKIVTALYFIKMYLQGFVKFGAVLLAAVPDGIIGLYFLYVWRSELNYALVASPRSEKNE